MATDARSRKYWWILAVLAIAGAVWLVVVSTGDGNGPPVAGDDAAYTDSGAARSPATEAEPPVTGAAGEDIVARVEQMRAAVRRYEDGCSSRLEQAAGEGIGALVVECTERLATAVDALVASDTVGQVAIDERFDFYREQVDRLEATPPGEGRAAPTRNVLRSVADLLEVIRDERYEESLGDDGALEDIGAAADALDPDRPLARQQEQARRFFLGAGALLSAMARPGDPGPSAP